MPEVQTTPALEHPGVELSRLLEEKGITDATVADEGKLSRPLVSQITNGNRRITPNSAQKICGVIGSSLGDDPRRDPMYWVRRQRDYDTALEDQTIRERAEPKPIEAAA